MQGVPRPGRGSSIRRIAGGGFRDIVAVGGPTFTSVANAASGSADFTFTEPCILDRLIVMAGAATQLVAGADAAERGSYVTAINLNGNALVSGNVPANMFSERSFHSPPFGHHVAPGVTTLRITILNESGATVEYGFGYTVR